VTTSITETRIPQLDSMRAIACLLVLVAHLDSIDGFPKLPAEAGPVGVAIFFALSGFLITRGLIRGPIDLTVFYMKRATRILPAYFLLLAALSLVWFGRELFWCATFTFNFLYISGARDYFHVPQINTPAPPVGHLWSICVEEHYYWLWPLVLVFFSRKIASLMLAAIVFATPVLAWWVVHSLDARGMHPNVFAGIVSRITVTQLTAVSLGSLIALHETALLRPVSWFKQQEPRLMFVGLLISLSCLLIRYLSSVLWGEFPDKQLYLQPTWIHGLGAGIMAMGLCWQRLGKLAWLRYIGKISYGLYLYHLPIYVAFGLARGQVIVWPFGLLAVMTTLAVASLSYHFMEHPIIEWGRGNSHGAVGQSKHANNHGLIAAGVLAALFAITLLANRNQPQFAALLNLSESIPIEQRRHEIDKVGTAIIAYRWLGVDHYGDGQGYRRTTRIPLKRPGVARLLTVGDSFTWGACVRETRTYSAVLEQELLRADLSIEVINGGKPGGQAEDVLERMKEQIQDFKPDIILYAATMTDFLPSNTGWGDNSMDGWYVPENQDRFVAAVRGMQELCDRQEIQFAMFAFFQDLSNQDAIKVMRLVEELGRKGGANVISAEAYSKENMGRDFRVYVPFDEHPNEECHALYGKLLAREMMTMQLLRR
jgi:peptidoglycan/LPS O-acetylase OafA/YrhL